MDEHCVPSTSLITSRVIPTGNANAHEISQTVTCAKPIVLASASPARSRLLSIAGVRFTVDPADLDEDTIRKTLIDWSAVDAATALTRRKAETVAARHADAVVIAADQILVLDDVMLGKPDDKEQAKQQLLALRGRTHSLVTAACVMTGWEALWEHTNEAQLTMWDFSDRTLDAYLERAGEALKSPGAYHLEGPGVALFSNVDGDYFSILGLPLLELMECLRLRGLIET